MNKWDTSNSNPIEDISRVISDMIDYPVRFEVSPLGKLLGQMKLFDYEENGMIGLTVQTLHDILCIVLFSLKYQLDPDRVKDLCGIDYSEESVEKAMNRLIKITGISKPNKSQKYTWLTIKCKCGNLVKVDIKQSEPGKVNKVRCPECTRFIKYEFNNNDEVVIPDDDYKKIDMEVLKNLGTDIDEIDKLIEMKGTKSNG